MKSIITLSIFIGLLVVGCGYNTEGYNWLGYDRTGFNKQGYDFSGFNTQGYNRRGQTRAEANTMNARAWSNAFRQWNENYQRQLDREASRPEIYSPYPPNWPPNQSTEWQERRARQDYWDEVYRKMGIKRY